MRFREILWVIGLANLRIMQPLSFATHLVPKSLLIKILPDEKTDAKHQLPGNTNLRVASHRLELSPAVKSTVHNTGICRQ